MMDDNEEYEYLLANLRELENDLEKKNQVAHELKNQITLASALCLDYTEELQTIKDENLQIELEAVKRNKDLQKVLNNLNMDYTDDIQHVEDLISSLELEIRDLEQKSIQNDHLKIKVEKNDLNRQALKEQQENLLAEVNEQIEAVEQNIADLNIRKEDVKDNLKQMQRHFKCQLKELDEVGEKIRSKQEQNRIYNKCCNVIKNLSLEPVKQGNSMFAEVKDAYEKLEQNIVKLQKQSDRIKVDIGKKSEEIKVVQKENEKLCEALDSVKDDVFDNDVVKSFQKEIHELKETMNEYYAAITKDFYIEGVNVPDYEIKFANSVIKSKWNDSVQQMKRLQSTFEDHFETSKQLIAKQFELRRFKRELLKLKYKNGQLEDSLTELRQRFSSLKREEPLEEISINNYSLDKENDPSKPENIDVDLLHFSPKTVCNATNDNSAKAFLSPQENIIDARNLEDICKSDTKHYYTLTTLSPSD